MLLAGDEFGHTQRGNNNAYCQDNEISWLDWNAAARRSSASIEFVRGLIALRREHPGFRRPRFSAVRPPPGRRSRTSRGTSPSGREMSGDDWRDDGRRCFGALLSRRNRRPLHAACPGFPEADDSFFSGAQRARTRRRLHVAAGDQHSRRGRSIIESRRSPRCRRANCAPRRDARVRRWRATPLALIAKASSG